MEKTLSQIKETADFLKNQLQQFPDVGIILGSGLGSFTKEIKIVKEIAYKDVPNFPVSTVEGHSGKLIFGNIGNKPIVAMSGRFHYYEGYSVSEVVFPVRVMKFLGIKNLLISNAAGGTNTTYKVGDLMIIKDHISFFTVNPLIGKNFSELGTRFPDMSEPYNKNLIDKAKAIAAKNKIELKEGVYCGVTGPSFETRAEYKLIGSMGGDAVGMSTVQEVIAAAHMQIPVFAMSVITDIGIREEENKITHAEVLQAANEAEPKLSLILKELIVQL